MIGGNEVREVPEKEWSACGGVGEEMAILEAILALWTVFSSGRKLKRYDREFDFPP